MPDEAMTSRTKALVELNIATFLYGFVGLFGKAITLVPYEIVFWRTTLAAFLLFFVGRRLKSHSKIRNKRDFLVFFAIAVFTTLQSVLFYHSLKISTIAIALITIYTYPIWMVFLESWFLREKLKLLDFASAVLVFFGLSYITPEFDLSNEVFKGTILGVSAGVMIPLIILTRKRFLVNKYTSWDISAYEMGLISLILLPFMAFGGSFNYIPSRENLVYLLLLGFVSTGIARILVVSSQKHLSGKIVGLTLILEVIYGIVFALICLSEVPTHREMVGGLIIISVVFFETLRLQKEGQRIPEIAPTGGLGRG
jgi:drug/metabolite transporter (DMT)-like permease